MDSFHGDGLPGPEIAGFWRRIFAFVIDCLLLGVVGWMLGAIFFDVLARMGSYARLIGFAIALAYFGIGNSRLGSGQTLGKRLLGLRVVDGHHAILSLPRSLARYVVLGIPFFVGGLPPRRLFNSDIDAAGLSAHADRVWWHVCHRVPLRVQSAHAPVSA